MYGQNRLEPRFPSAESFGCGCIGAPIAGNDSAETALQAPRASSGPDDIYISQPELFDVYSFMPTPLSAVLRFADLSVCNLRLSYSRTRPRGRYGDGDTWPIASTTAKVARLA